MFRNPISSSPFAGESGDAMFPKIKGGPVEWDVSFITTARILLNSRIPDGESVSIGYEKYYEMDYWLIPDGAGSNTLLIANVICRKPEDGFEKRLDDSFLQHGWEKQAVFSQFFKKFFCRNYINRETKSSVILVFNMTLIENHAIQAGILPALPWYNSKTDERERALITACLGTSDTAYMDAVSQFVDDSFRDLHIRTELANYEETLRDRMIERTRKEVERYRANIAQYHEQIRHWIEDIQDLNIQISGLMNGTRNPVMMDYFLANKNLIFVNAEESGFLFDACADAYVDEDLMQAVIKNQFSWLSKMHEYRKNGKTYEINFEGLMEELFIQKTCTLKMISQFRFSVSGVVRPIPHADYGIYGIGFLPNPHIDDFACVGEYSQLMEDAAIEGDYVGVLDICGQSAGSLNVNDYAVMERFVESLEDTREKCIVFKNGERMTPNDAALKLMEANK